MTKFSNVLILAWCLIFGVPFISVLMDTGRHSSLLYIAWPHYLLIGLLFYIIGVPAIYLLEKRAPSSLSKYRILKYISFITTYLMVRLFFGDHLPDWSIVPFFVFYASMGFFALLTIWLFIVAIKISEIKFFEKSYVYMCVAIVNVGGLLSLALSDYKSLFK